MQPHRRVHVARQPVAARARPVGGPRVAERFVAQHEGPQRDRCVDDLDAERGRRITGTVVVVAAHQHEVERRAIAPPRAQRVDGLGRLRGARVQQVAEHDQAARAAVVDQRAEPAQRGRGGAGRHRHAERAEGLGLAEVHVGDEQRGAGRPPERAAREQTHRLARELDVEPAEPFVLEGGGGQRAILAAGRRGPAPPANDAGSRRRRGAEVR